MRFWQKLASGGVLAVVILLPFLSMAMCLPEDSGLMKCPPECSMMAKMSHQGMQMNLSEAPGSCCQIGSSKPAPVTESNTVRPTISVEPTVVSAPQSPTFRVRTVASVAFPPPVVSDHQAELCTFLI